MRNGTYKQGQAPYGFRVCDGAFTIIEEEAEIVRLIFLAYKEGKSLQKIANELTEMGIKKANGDTKWHSNHIKYILTNVRYKGDALLQKSYTTEFPFKSVLNRGELDMYYVKNTNPAIVSAELFDTVAGLFKIQSERLNSRGYLEPALYHERKGVLNSQIVELKKDRKQMSGRDECSISIKETERICEYIQKNGSINGFDEKAFENTVKRIIAKNNILTFELKNGMKLRVETE